MKRDAFGDEGGPHNKRFRNSDDEVSFLIPSKVAGSIIGKGGVNISKLRNEYKASITVPDCPGPERVLTIGANDMDTTIDILKEVLPKLADPQNQKGNSDDLDLRLLIHQSRAGCVIGKAGSKIKELREKTGARLKIFSNAAPQSTVRVVQLLGNDESVCAAVREVLELIVQTPIKGSIQPYDPHNYDDFYADEYGGFGAGQGGRNMRGGPPMRGPPPRMPMGMGPPMNGPGGRGPPPMRGGPMNRGGPGPAPRPPFQDFPPARNHPAPRPTPAPFNSSGNNGGQETTTQVTIPKDLAGAIIGKAGSRIRKIRMESGAGIEIAEPLPGANERVITIAGTPPQIQMAQYLLQQSVHENNPNMGRNNY